MPLHLQHHKSYHPYNKDNIERVRRDEEAARLAEEGKAEQSLQAESEARLETLKRRRKGHSDGDEGRLKAAERELDGKKGALDEYDRKQRGGALGTEAGPSRMLNPGDNLVDKSGHINFWAGQEASRKRHHSNGGADGDASAVVSRHRGNKEYEADKNAEKQKWEEQTTLFLGKPAKELQPWYQSRDLKSGEERKKSHEQRLEAAYKDSVIKRSHDPLKAMPVIDAQRQRPTANLIQSSANRHSSDDLHSKAEARERRERARAEDLIAARQAAASTSFKIEETPTPARGEYHDQFYKEDVRAAREDREAGGSGRRSERDFRERPEMEDPGGLLKSTKTGIKENDGDDKLTMMKDDTIATTAERRSEPLQPLDPNTVNMNRSSSNSSTESSSSTDSKGRPKESMYPVIFGEMISTVLDKESYLFTTSEQALLRSYFKMNYEARHLLARLIQRRSSWHRLDRLQYDFDVKDKALAIATLCTPLQIAEGSTDTDESQDDDIIPTRFCLSERDMEGGEEEALALLSLDELKVIGRNMNRLKGSMTTKASIIASLLTTKSQGTLHGFTANSAAGSQPTTVRSQSQILQQTLREVIGGCVRVCPKAQKLVNRIALVYYRGAELGGSALTTAVLSRSRKRTYPIYAWQRTSALFASRKHLIAMERAISIETQMDELIEWDGSKEALHKAMKLFESVYQEWQEAVKEGQGLADAEQATIDRLTYHRMRFHPGWPLTRIVYKGVHVLARFHQHTREAEVLRSLLSQRIFRRGRRGDWYDRLALITAQYPGSTTAVEVRKAKRQALAISIEGIQDPDTHLIYHDTLQRRIARLESQLKLPFAEKHDFSYAKLKRCEDRVFAGIRLDKMVGAKSGLFGSSFVNPADMKSRPKVSRYSSSSSSSEKSETSAFKVRKPLHKVVKVEKIETDPTVKTEAGTEQALEFGEEEARQIESRQVRKDMHSVWRGLDGKPCRVEVLVLQHYDVEGFRGYHCEGGILTMLFALLMWDVLFTPLPGVFETPYQKQPLDLSEDSFAIVRGPLLRQRLSDIEETGGLHFIEETDIRERDRKTWAVGCRWDQYPREDLMEIAECMGGKALAVICQMLSEEWDKITAGLPDLCIWRYSDRKVRFCEVKGPGDRLSDKQKLWIDILLRAGLDVEVSLVQEKGTR